MNLRDISIILVLTFLAGVCSLHAQTAPFAQETTAQVASEQPGASAPSADRPAENGSDTQGLVPIEPSRDPKFSTAEFRSNRIPWENLPIIEGTAQQFAQGRNDP